MPSIAPPPDRRLCLATVTTESFVTGTLVMLHSFLACNPWYEGDVVVIHDRLVAEHRRALGEIYDRVHFLQASPQITARVDEVTAAFQDVAWKRARFLSIEAFRLRDYGRVLFCDSDLLFRRSIRELFELPASLVACGDGYHYQDRARHWGSAAYRDTFNAGLVLIDRALLTDDEYAGLLMRIDPRSYRVGAAVVDDKLTDQMALNIHFAGRQHLVSATYNCLLAHRAAIEERDGIRWADAHVLHYNGPIKPWLVERVLAASRWDPGLIETCECWNSAYIACLERLSVDARALYAPVTSGETA